MAETQLHTQTEIDKMTAALNSVARFLDTGADLTGQLMAAVDLPVVICGVGKSHSMAILGADLMRSVGVMAVAQHATDVLHGGLGFLGRVRDEKVLIVISNSGNTHEVIEAAEAAQAVGTSIIVITGNPDGLLAKAYPSCSIVYETPLGEGSRHLTLPTASAAAQLGVFSAWAAAVANRLYPHHLAAAHPAGSLGRTYEEMDR